MGACQKTFWASGALLPILFLNARIEVQALDANDTLWRMTSPATSGFFFRIQLESQVSRETLAVRSTRNLYGYQSLGWFP